LNAYNHQQLVACCQKYVQALQHFIQMSNLISLMHRSTWQLVRHTKTLFTSYCNIFPPTKPTPCNCLHQDFY